MDTPELDKVHAVKQQSDAIGEFIEWLHTHGHEICGPTASNDPYYLLEQKSTTVWLAEYFGIDLEKVDQEQKAILENLRNTVHVPVAFGVDEDGVPEAEE